ncbi:GtrA family protein [Altererythrobacter lauratis]|uniref:GtrA family protein n=1 Tax=Alteraurantiacibacter lauratis TaxID=2054627 RepID=A0ABV7EFN9_9SPHN
MIDLIQHLRRVKLIRYFGASVIALAADMGSFLALLAMGAMAAPASAASYSLGILVHWLISSRKVFADSVATSGLARTRQKALFVISALAGLGLTFGIVWAGDTLGLDPRLAKLVAVGFSFSVTWLMRTHFVFRVHA